MSAEQEAAAAGAGVETARLTATAALAAGRRILPWLIETRHDFHRHPELGLEEHWTSERIRGHLTEIGIEHIGGLAGTGVLGLLRGRVDGPTVALRADIDALPMEDAKDVPYRSQHPGKVHACGHDVHTTVQLGAARILAGLAGELPGTVKLIFQPAEETVGGAELLIAEGVLENPAVDAIFGLHVEPRIDAGKLGVRFGHRNAASDTITLTVHGRSGHGAYPAGTVDAIVVAAKVVSVLQTIVSRNVDARQSAVLSFGTIQGGSQRNIVASRVELTGTLRTLETEVRELVLERLHETAEGVAAALGGRAEIEIEAGYEALVNDDRMVELVRENGVELLGEENVIVRSEANMGVEDFAHYLREVRGAFFSLGVRNEARGIVHGVHHEKFDIDDEALAVGAAVQALNALRALERPC